VASILGLLIHLCLVVKRPLPPLSTARVRHWGDRREAIGEKSHSVLLLSPFSLAAAAVILSACHVGCPERSHTRTNKIEKEEEVEGEEKRSSHLRPCRP